MTTIYQTSWYFKKIQQIDMAGKKCTFSNPVSENDFVLCDIVSYYFRLILRKSAYFKLGVSANLSTKRIFQESLRFHFTENSINIRYNYYFQLIFTALLPNPPHQKSSSFLRKCST